ncbi:MAG TPA: murein biosynthesis integral membrane protein MurJ [Steroidobacteraceae bacterium]|jgi:putative peptidoglycan lipid II flippase|nr:murein biosynthesis integral membrane protein MurJ [Steroidobacteraceae bacterium]
MRSTTSPPRHQHPTQHTDSSPVATEVVAPDKGTERLNTRAAGIISLAVMCSRVLGLARDQLCAALFGAGAMDLFTVAFRIPNLLRDLFAEGALSTVFVTTFSKTIALEGDGAAWRLANKVATLATLVLGALCALGMVFSHQLVALLAPGFDAEKARLTAVLTRIMFPFILMVSLAALVMGILNAKSIFGRPAMASSFFNLGSIVGGVSLGAMIDPSFGPRALIGLSVGTLIGGGLQLAVQLPPLKSLGYGFRPDFEWRDRGVIAILALMGPAVIAASTTQVNVLVNSMFASTLGSGAIFWLASAFRLMQLPLGLFGVALGTVTLPLLSRLVVANRLDAFRSELARALRLMFLLTIPSTIGLMMLADPIMSVLYQHGKFDAYEAMQAGGALRFYAVGLAGYAALKVLVNAFYALDRRKTPMIVSFLAVGLNLLFNWLFTFHLGWGHRGLAFSTGCVASCNFLLLYFLMHRQLGNLESRRMLLALVKIGIAGAVLAAVCWASTRWLLPDWATQAFWSKALALFGTVLAAGIAFVAVAAALRLEELTSLLSVVARRLRSAT